MEKEQANDSVKNNSDTTVISKMPDMISISACEYEDYKKYKDRLSTQRESGHKALIINERVSRELAEVQERAVLQDKLLIEAYSYQ
ncbi:DUF1357 family protein (plasmid) [Borrelia miyamotoi]|uniref:DUF1357 family protein n=1 Tax=Borrelia miyamotoi TaxID=47466 RepID=A0A5P8AYA7_9SPIR|nr:DUF1357 family protein [Borrelia miyamotoi]